MSNFFQLEDGYYSLTSAGTILFVILIAVFLLLAAVLKNQSQITHSKSFSAKQLVFSAAALALAFATSYVKLIHMPWGGSVTLCSMLFVTLIGWWYGPKIGLSAAVSYALLQFLQSRGSYILSPVQVCLDYIFAFAALGLSGLFYRSKNGLIKGYFFAVLLRGAFHSLGGYLFWMEYMPDNFPKNLAALYPICYNYAYLLLEAAITIILLMLPSVRKAMAWGKQLANE